jgi:hypothetical protein
MALPVDPARLRKEFPDLTDDDLQAYVAVTKRILEAGVKDRARVTREVMESGRQAREKAARGAKLSREEAKAASYLAALDKVQRSTVKR